MNWSVVGVGGRWSVVVVVVVVGEGFSQAVLRICDGNIRSLGKFFVPTLRTSQFSGSLAGDNLAHRIAMRPTKSFRDLDVWREAMTLVEEIYALSKRFPPDERFGLTSQLRRAAVSIPSNIGEGGRRKKWKAHLYHLDIALGSQGEVDVQIELAMRLGFCRPSDVARLQPRIDRIGRMLNGLIESLETMESQREH